MASESWPGITLKDLIHERLTSFSKADLLADIHIAETTDGHGRLPPKGPSKALGTQALVYRVIYARN